MTSAGTSLPRRPRAFREVQICPLLGFSTANAASWIGSRIFATSYVFCVARSLALICVLNTKFFWHLRVAYCRGSVGPASA